MIQVKARMLYPKNRVSPNREFSRLISAAVVNQRFCNLLLINPMIALSTGYNGESFHLTAEAQ